MANDPAGKSGLQISAELVSTPLKPYRTRVHWRDTMNYAAAVGDANPFYFDDERADGIIAPPLFGAALTWPIIENLPQYLQTENFPSGVLQTQVHYTEHLTCHQPIRPEHELTIRGAIAAIFPRRTGTYLVLRLEAMDAAEETPVFTEHIGALLRGVQCSGEGRGARSLPGTPPGNDDRPLLWERRIAVDPLLPYIYDGCSRIFFPIHTSKKFAHRAGLPGIILQGTATLALAARELVDREAGADPRRLKQIHARFTEMVRPGDVITLKVYGALPGRGDIDRHFVVENAAGKAVISDGYARVAALQAEGAGSRAQGEMRATRRPGIWP